jgi:hypothetical protein
MSTLESQPINTPQNPTIPQWPGLHKGYKPHNQRHRPRDGHHHGHGAVPEAATALRDVRNRTRQSARRWGKPFAREFKGVQNLGKVDAFGPNGYNLLWFVGLYPKNSLARALPQKARY